MPLVVSRSVCAPVVTVSTPVTERPLVPSPPPVPSVAVGEEDHSVLAPAAAPMTRTSSSPLPPSKETRTGRAPPLRSTMSRSSTSGAMASLWSAVRMTTPVIDGPIGMRYAVPPLTVTVRFAPTTLTMIVRTPVAASGASSMTSVATKALETV